MIVGPIRVDSCARRRRLPSQKGQHRKTARGSARRCETREERTVQRCRSRSVRTALPSRSNPFPHPDPRTRCNRYPPPMMSAWTKLAAGILAGSPEYTLRLFRPLRSRRVGTQPSSDSRLGSGGSAARRGFRWRRFAPRRWPTSRDHPGRPQTWWVSRKALKLIEELLGINTVPLKSTSKSCPLTMGLTGSTLSSAWKRPPLHPSGGSRSSRFPRPITAHRERGRGLPEERLGKGKHSPSVRRAEGGPVAVVGRSHTLFEQVDVPHQSLAAQSASTPTR